MLVKGMAQKQTQTNMVASGNWDTFDNLLYNPTNELAITFTSKRSAAARGSRLRNVGEQPPHDLHQTWRQTQNATQSYLV